jgi:hypothetical protein
MARRKQAVAAALPEMPEERRRRPTSAVDIARWVSEEEDPPDFCPDAPSWRALQAHAR